MENLPALQTMIILFLAISLFVIPFASPSPQSSLSKGSSLSVEEDSDILVSPNESFSFGFHRIGNNAYALSIWFSNSADKTIAWTANRDYPVNGFGSSVTFREGGALVLTDVDGTVVWSTNTSSTQADEAQLLDNGNLVIKDPQGNVLWQSFDSPTDTLLPTQPITKNKKLVSSMPGGSVSSGFYSFYFDNDNVMKLMYDGPQVSSIYWPNPDYNIWQNGRYNYNSSRYGAFDESGTFQSSDRLSFNASEMGVKIMRRLTLDSDGNLRLYNLNNSTGLWSVSWEALPNLCDVHGMCGRNGICVYNTQKPMCACPFAYEVSASSDWSEGCKPKFNISCEDSQQLRFVELKKTDFWGFDLNYTPSVTLGACLELCRKDCLCMAFSYKMGSGNCYTKSALFNGRTGPDFPGSLYLKLPLNFNTSDFYVLQVHEPVCNVTGATVSAHMYAESTSSRTKWTYFYWFISTFGLIEIFFIAFGWWFVSKKGTKPTSIEEGYKLIARQFKRFTYKELKKATRNFKYKLERGGGSRAVYKGVLEDERVVAVEKLDDVIPTEAFWAEVSVIARINHMNLVRIWGFCSERSHRFLVSEFMENGSLDKHLFGGGHSSAGLLGWKERFQIAVGVAKGLAYLHHECLEWVIHCDVKPENILLASDFEPKITDFGLAKLVDRGGAHSKISKVRGSRGYMAPEWALNLPITAKVDVYSYGVVLLELLMGSRASDWKKTDGGTGDEEEEAELELLGLVRMLKLKLGEGAEDSWIDDFVDARLAGQFNRRQAAVMVEMAISCVEEERSKRPNMNTVAEILNGQTDEPCCHANHSYSDINLE